ncbi:IS21-like element helper ATPase IstB, partial [Streptomyces clavuligerus]
GGQGFAAAAEGRVRAAGFPARRSLEEFDGTHERHLDRYTLSRLGRLEFVRARGNVVLLGPPGSGTTHLAVALGTRACQAGHGTRFATAAEWVARLTCAHAEGRLTEELVVLDRYALLIVDGVGAVPFDTESTRLLHRLVSHRYARGSVVVTADRPFGRWSEVFGDSPATSSMVDRVAHHAEVVTLTGEGRRLRDHDRDRGGERALAVGPDLS